MMTRAAPRGIAARLWTPLLDRIDTGLVAGTLIATLPGGNLRVFGGRGAGPIALVMIVRWRALARLALSGSVGWYEGHAAGDWTSPDPVPIFDLFMRNRATLGASARARGLSRLVKRLRHALRANHKRGAKRNILAHYDLGNDFYAAWLDLSMTYSSAIFAHADEPLADAQARKVAAILDRCRISQGDTLLEIGCGWGGLAGAAQARGAAVTAISLSPAQLDYARAHHPRADFREVDYRDVRGHYDAIASVEMVEAVGQAYWPAYLDAIARCLKPGGRAAIQYIAIADDIFPDYARGVDFIQRYVFPGGMLLSQSRFRALAEARGLCWEDERHFGNDYAQTLRRWREAFDAATLPPHFDARFRALWRYYLMYCEGGFRGGGITVAQVTLVKEGAHG